MERLTERDEYGNAEIIGIDEPIGFDLGFDELNKLTDALNKLAEYEELEKQGRLLRLPCKVGDPVYLAHYNKNTGAKWIITTTFAGIHIADKVGKHILDKPKKYLVIRHSLCGHSEHVAFDKIGSFAFFDRKEAEQALEGGRE